MKTTMKSMGRSTPPKSRANSIMAWPEVGCGLFPARFI
jgi:hypothetical protein